MKFLKTKTVKDKAFQDAGVADPRSGAFVYTGDLGSPRSKRREEHTAPTKYGMGDYYGTSMKAPIGKVRDATVGYRPVNRKQFKTPPRNLV